MSPAERKIDCPVEDSSWCIKGTTICKTKWLPGGRAMHGQKLPIATNPAPTNDSRCCSQHGRESWEPLKRLELNPQCHAHRATNTMQAYGTTKHALTKNTAEQRQPQGSLTTCLGETLQNAPKRLTTLTDGQDTKKRLLRNATDQTSSWS